MTHINPDPRGDKLFFTNGVYVLSHTQMPRMKPVHCLLHGMQAYVLSLTLFLLSLRLAPFTIQTEEALRTATSLGISHFCWGNRWRRRSVRAAALFVRVKRMGGYRRFYLHCASLRPFQWSAIPPSAVRRSNHDILLAPHGPVCRYLWRYHRVAPSIPTLSGYGFWSFTSSIDMSRISDAVSDLRQRSGGRIIASVPFLSVVPVEFLSRSSW